MYLEGIILGCKEVIRRSIGERHGWGGRSHGLILSDFVKEEGMGILTGLTGTE